METAFFKHVFIRYYDVNVGFAYWRGRKEEEVDIVADVQGRLVPFEVKYTHQHTGAGDLKGLVAFCSEKRISRGYVVTGEMSDFSVLPLNESPAKTRILKIPAPLACYWLGRSELLSTRRKTEEL